MYNYAGVRSLGRLAQAGGLCSLRSRAATRPQRIMAAGGLRGSNDSARPLRPTTSISGQVSLIKRLPNERLDRRLPAQRRSAGSPLRPCGISKSCARHASTLREPAGARHRRTAGLKSEPCATNFAVMRKPRVKGVPVSCSLTVRLFSGFCLQQRPNSRRLKS